MMQRLRDTECDSSLNIYKQRVVEYYDHFLFRNHYCFVLELLAKTLYSDLKEGGFKGFDLKTKLRPLAYQLIQGLVYIKHCRIIHCDLKPENLMYSDSRRKNLKIIDFGASSSFGMNTFTYVQSRFYRAPEVVLGLQYDHQVDMWSLGCIIAELFCGRPIFPGIDENELLEFHILMCGNPPQHMVERCSKRAKFFNTLDGKMIRSPQSRLANINSRSQASLYQMIFPGRFNN